MNDLPFLTHDIGARNDPKLMELQMDMGGQGLGIFWCLVEMLWENGGSIPANYKSIAFALRWCKPAEVEKVVAGYGLFQVEDGNITSRSASERIRVKREKSESLSASRSNAANARWKQRRSKDDASAMQPQCECNADAMQSDASIYLSINKSINQSNNNTPLTAADIYDFFLFEMNFKDPAGEAERFIIHYRDKEDPWTYADGNPVKDPMEAARKWKPVKPGKRFDVEALNWYRAVWNAASNRIRGAHSAFVEGFRGIRRNGNQIAIVFLSRDAAMTVASFVQENDLAGDYVIDYRLES